MTIRLCAWLRRRSGSIGKTRPQEASPACASPEPLPAPKFSPLFGKTDLNSQQDTPPPSYATLDLRDALFRDATRQPPKVTVDENIFLETLRARNPATRPPSEDASILRPPPHHITPIAVAKAAACEAVIGVERALDELDPRMVAARTAQAIAVAVSTSRSYAAFLAAVTAAESAALLVIEDSRDQQAPFVQLKDRHRYSIRSAANTAVAADAGSTAAGPWPFNMHDNSSPELFQQQKQQVFENGQQLFQQQPKM